MSQLRLPRRIYTNSIIFALLIIACSAIIGIGLTRSSSVHADQTCPCSLFNDVTPTVSDYNDGHTQTFGIHFRPEVDGYVTGVKFYKSALATGTNKGTLWSPAGTVLAQGTFSNETASGWQTLTFDTPVPVTAHTMYTAGYTTDNYYVATGNYFDANAVHNFPLTITGINEFDGLGFSGNGTYADGDTYPHATFNGGNYWADVTFIAGDQAQTAPTVQTATPANNATDMSINVVPSAVFNTYLDNASLTSTNAFIKDSSGTTVASSASFNQAKKQLDITPTFALTLGETYTVTLKGGAGGIQSLNGVALANDYSWQFTVQSQSQCPCSVYDRQPLSSDATANFDTTPDPVTLGVEIQSSANGYLTGIRFYRQLISTAPTHTVGLYTMDGQLVDSATTSQETARGWQTATFSTPVAITANTPYMITYTSTDHYLIYGTNLTNNLTSGPMTVIGNSSHYIYSANSSFPVNKAGTNVNYYIDPVFSESSSAKVKLEVVTSEPTNQSYGVDTHKPLSVTFTEPLDTSTTANALSLHTAGGQAVAGTTSYDNDTGALTFTPASQLAYSTGYVLSVSSTVKDISGAQFDGSNYALNFTTGVAATTSLNDGKGGKILVITSSSNKFSTYTVEMLRAEGINYFTVKDVNDLNSSLLADYHYVLLGSSTLSSSQVSNLQDWVINGGNLIAFKPDKQLASLLGIVDAGGTLDDGYIKVNTAVKPGKGIVGETIQYHTTADRYTVSSATAVAMLYSDASTATFNPAVTTRVVGKGHAASFAYDLPKSIALQHQGNPAWINHNGNTLDGPIRPDSLFRYSGQTSWVDLTKAHIPQADEQQRLLVNMLTNMSTESTATGPAPHYWYLPHGYKAALEMTSDDHGTYGGTATFMNAIDATNYPACSIVDWTCTRVGSLVYTPGGPSVRDATIFNKFGYPLGMHVATACNNQSVSSLQTNFTSQLNAFASTYPDLPAQTFGRLHCYIWSGWVDIPKIDLAHGIRYTMEYEWYPPSWTGSYTGFLGGTTQIMRFVDTDGELIDVYNAPTDLDYETDPSSNSINADLAGATGASAYYGIYGTHYDYSNTYQDLLVATAKSYGVPLISAAQALAWKDAQSNSTFGITSSSPYQVVFSPQVAEGGEGTLAMIPTHSSNGALASIVKSGSAVSYNINTIKGIEYAFFTATPGTYTATYGNAPEPPKNNGGSHHPTKGSGSGSARSSSTNTDGAQPYATIYDGATGPASPDATNQTTTDDTITDNNVTNNDSTTTEHATNTPSAPKKSPVTIATLAAASTGALVVIGSGLLIIGAIRKRKHDAADPRPPFQP